MHTHKVICRSGVPLCYMPMHHQAAASVLQLYPAQKLLARCARAGLSALVRVGMPLPLQRATPPHLPFDAIRWAPAAAHVPQQLDPDGVGVLAGNPHTRGQRFIYLLCDRHGAPLCVIKAGFSPEAQRKILEERSFLGAHASHTPGLPPVWGEVDRGGTQAVILPFYQGDHPATGVPETVIGSWLSQWIQPLAPQPWDTWEDLASLPASAQTDQLQGRKLTPVLQHGDFAPWNILVDAAGTWHVLDWERGTDRGIPAWDWFHFVVQPAVLVRHETPARVCQRFERLIQTKAFRTYAQKTGIAGIEPFVFHAYLQYVTGLLDAGQRDRAASAMRAVAAVLIEQLCPA